MAAAADILSLAGAFEAQYGRRSSAGYMLGTSPTPDSPGTNFTTHARRLRGFVEVSELQYTVAEVDFYGGMHPLGKLQIGVDTVSGFQLTLAGHDQTLKALATDSTVDVTTYDDSTVEAPNTNKGDLPQGMLCLSCKAQLVDGTNDWLHILYNNVQMRPLNPRMSSQTGRNPNPGIFQVTATQATRAMTGVLLANYDIDVEESSDYYILLRTKNRIAFTTFVHNGVAATFQLGYKPVATDATGEGKNRYAKNGTIGSVTSVSTTGLVTMTAAGTSGDVSTMAYDTAFLPAA